MKNDSSQQPQMNVPASSQNNVTTTLIFNVLWTLIERCKNVEPTSCVLTLIKRCKNGEPTLCSNVNPDVVTMFL